MNAGTEAGTEVQRPKRDDCWDGKRRNHCPARLAGKRYMGRTLGRAPVPSHPIPMGGTVGQRDEFTTKWRISEMKQIPREQRLGDFLGEWGVAGLKRYFVARIEDGDTFNQICESMRFPYRRTAEIVGWNYRQRKFGEPYEFRDPTPPARPAIELPQPPPRSQADQLRPVGTQCENDVTEI